MIKTTWKLAKIAWMVLQALHAEDRHPGGRHC
jgi:hypothetical protein